MLHTVVQEVYKVNTIRLKREMDSNTIRCFALPSVTNRQIIQLEINKEIPASNCTTDSSDTY